LTIEKQINFIRIIGFWKSLFCIALFFIIKKFTVVNTPEVIEKLTTISLYPSRVSRVSRLIINRYIAVPFTPRGSRFSNWIKLRDWTCLASWPRHK